MEARLLEYFLRVVELGSINRAAAELNLSQPSLSRWLSLLEREIGSALLIRTRQGIRTTDAGQVLVERVQPVLRQLHLLRDEIGKKATAQVTLGMPVSMQRVVTAPFAEEILRNQPHISLRVYEGINNAIRRWMEEGLLDAGIMVLTERAPRTFSAFPLATEQLMLVGDCNARLRLDTPVTLSRLDAADLILPGRPNAIRAQIENAIRRAGYAYRCRFEAETVALCLELTRRGLGYTVTPSCALDNRVFQDEDLTAAPIRNLTVTWALHINRAREHSVAVRALTTALRNFVVATISARKWRFAQVVKVGKRRKAV
ncbi:MAG: LysR family transcriptional regulator [Xanthobacteraceae bacterium]|nr:LysR family transcriptional regulator [Xanthobacteraceae bacterium]